MRIDPLGQDRPGHRPATRGEPPQPGAGIANMTVGCQLRRGRVTPATAIASPMPPGRAVSRSAGPRRPSSVTSSQPTRSALRRRTRPSPQESVARATRGSETLPGGDRSPREEQEPIRATRPWGPTPGRSAARRHRLTTLEGSRHGDAADQGRRGESRSSWKPGRDRHAQLNAARLPEHGSLPDQLGVAATNASPHLDGRRVAGEPHGDHAPIRTPPVGDPGAGLHPVARRCLQDDLQPGTREQFVGEQRGREGRELLLRRPAIRSRVRSNVLGPDDRLETRDGIQGELRAHDPEERPGPRERCCVLPHHQFDAHRVAIGALLDGHGTNLSHLGSEITNGVAATDAVSMLRADDDRGPVLLKRPDGEPDRQSEGEDGHQPEEGGQPRLTGASSISAEGTSGEPWAIGCCELSLMESCPSGWESSPRGRAHRTGRWRGGSGARRG